MALDLIERARRYVAKVPPAISGSGGHNATFTAACALVKGFDLSIDQARPLLAEYNLGCQPPWSEAELEHKLRQADTTSDDRARGWLGAKGENGGSRNADGGMGERIPSRAASAPLPAERERKPEFAENKLKTFAARWRQFIDTVWLAERSTVLPFALSGPVSADEFLRAVYRCGPQGRAGEQVVIFTNHKSQGQAIWPLQKIPEAGDEGVWFLAQPVDGKEQPNPRSKLNDDGSPKLSRRSAEAVTDWRHLVLESDEADPRDWLGALVQLPLRVVAIYTSGGRSIHALVRIDAPTEGEWNNTVKQIRPILVTLGADPKAMSAVRLTRLPGCWRGTGPKRRLQKLLYLDPAPEPVPICRQEKRHDALGWWLSNVATVTRLSVADVRRSEDWPEVELLRDALRWYESTPVAKDALGRLKAWMEEGA